MWDRRLRKPLLFRNSVFFEDSFIKVFSLSDGQTTRQACAAARGRETFWNVLDSPDSTAGELFRFFRRGVLSVPALHRYRSDKDNGLMSQTLWVEDFVAFTANAEKLPRSSIWVPNRQSQIGPGFQMLHVMDQLRPPITVTQFTELTFTMIQVKDVCTDIFPLRPVVKPVGCSIGQHCLKLGKSKIRNQGGSPFGQKQKATANNHARFPRWSLAVALKAFALHDIHDVLGFAYPAVRDDLVSLGIRKHLHHPPVTVTAGTR